MMTTRIVSTIAVAFLISAPGAARAQASSTGGTTKPGLPSFSRVINGHSEIVTWKGMQAVKLVPASSMKGRDEVVLAIIDGAEFGNGTIELQVSGAPRADAPPDSRG